MFNRTKQNRHHSLATMVLALLMVCSLSVTAFATADLSSTIAVTGLTANSSGAMDWTASAGGAAWEGTTTSDGGCSPNYTATNGTLKFTNNSDSTLVLSFDYELSLNGGTFTIAGSGKTSNGSYSATLANGASVQLVASSSTSAVNTTKVTLKNIKLAAESVNITFAPATNGSYTLNSTPVTANKTVTNPNTTTYKLVATPADNYYFAGWYLGDTKVSENATENAIAFANSGTVTAKFNMDPLYAKTATAEGSSKTKDELVSINTFYLHDSTEKLVKDGSLPGSNSAYSKLAQSQTKDKVDIQYIPSRVWNDSMSISYSGSAMGDYGTGGAQESYAYARVLSDVIRIYAKENCNVSFSYNGSISTSGSTAVENNTSATFYTYVTTASTATVAQVQGGAKYTGSGTTPSIALSKGQYLYIVAEGYAKNRYMALISASQFTMDFDYSASITGLTVEFNEKKDVLTAGFRDNTGKVLTSGSINVNNVGQTIGSNGNITDMSFADLAAVSMSVSSVPANYVHIGWEITPKGGSTTYQYTPSYSRTLTEDVTVNALFVPKTTITMGANGYADASYKDFNGNALNGQYVARNSGRTEYYTSLADAFSKTDTVVLLAGTTIEGDWTIPAGKTFVIPYGLEDAGSTTPAMAWGMGADYCLVNLNGNLNVEGTLIVNAQQNQSTGATGGNPGHLIVASGKTITVSGSLYAYGPVTGAGKVETTSTAKIHETLEFSDNDVVIYIYNIYNEKSSKKVFPFNTMFVNSIEIPVTYQQGATLTGHVAVKYDTVSTAAIPIIAPSNAMMNHTAGTITKYFDHSTGQFVFRYNEGSKVSTGTFSITLSVTVVGMEKEITMNSSDFYIPLSAPFRYEISGDLTLHGKYKLLPGMVIDVKESGKLTIADDGEVVAYRRNDFDFRGKSGDTTQTGYTRQPYPQNPQRFNGVSYPFSFNNSNMGSAKLNVDGELIVNGGLYVTDKLNTNITVTANGYNNLTGTGRIDMTNAATSLASIDEVMRAGGTNDLAWDTTAVVPLKGLKADATADEAAQYESLDGKTVTGSTNANGLNVWGADPCASGHALTETAAKASNCYQQGNSAYWTCETCKKYFDGKTEIAKDSWILELADHTYDEGVVTKAPNCTEKGVKTYTCSVCPDGTEGHTKTEDVNATNHVNKTAYAAAESSCFKQGNSAYWFCDDCDKYFSDEACSNVIEKDAWLLPLADHQYGDGVVTTNPTCTEKGVETYTCSVCSEDAEGHIKTEEIPALGHTEEVVAGKAATCTETGLTDGAKCSVCGVTLTAQEEIPALGHTEEVVAGKAATCTENGLTEGKKCTVCGVTTVEQEEIPALGHTEVIDEAIAPDCTKTGLTEGKHCSVCNTVLVAQEIIPVNKDNHVDLEHVDKLDPTCERLGHEAYEYCTSCGYTTYVEIPMLAHFDMDGDKDHLCDNNCGTKVSDCGVTYVDYQGGSIEVHNEDIAALKASTFIQDMGVGTLLEKIEYCAAGAADMSEGLLNTLFANAQFREFLASELNTDIDSLDQYLLELSGDEGDITKIQANAVVLYVAKLASEMETENIINFLTKGVEAYEFIYNGVAVDDQCGEAVTYAALTYGMYNAYAYGDFGGNMEIASDAVESITQLKDDSEFLNYLNSEDGKCDLNGFLAGLNTINNRLRIAHLDAVGDAYLESAFLQEKNELVEHLLTNGYTGDELTQLLQEQIDGYSHQCAECGETLTDCIWTDASCTEARKCILCGKIDGETPGHSYEAVVTAPTCTEAGYTTYTCSACGDSYVDDEVAALGHSHAEPEKSDWNWTDSGEAGYSATVTLTCEKCQVTESVEANVTSEEADGKVIYTATVTSGVKTYTDTKTVDIAEHEHSYDEGTVTKEATCVEDGVRTFTCECGQSYTESIPATGHTEGEAVKENEVAATCTTAGSYDSVVKCSACGIEISREAVTVDALGHSFVDGKCTYCGDVEPEDGPIEADDLVFNKIGISFQNYIGLQSSVKNTVYQSYDKVYVVANGTDLKPIPFGSQYVFDYQVIATEMTKEVTLALYGEKNGKTYIGESKSWSVERLALDKMAAYESAGRVDICTALVDMLNYGAAAQRYMHSLGNTEQAPYADANLGVYSKYATTEDLVLSEKNETFGTGSIVAAKIGMSMQSVLEINMSFKQDMSVYEAHVTVNGETTIFKGKDFTKLNSSTWVLQVPIGAAKVREAFTIIICDAEGMQVSPTYVFSAAGYASEKLGDSATTTATVNLLKAMIRYGDAVAPLS